MRGRLRGRIKRAVIYLPLEAKQVDVEAKPSSSEVIRSMRPGFVWLALSSQIVTSV